MGVTGTNVHYRGLQASCEEWARWKSEGTGQMIQGRQVVMEAHCISHQPSEYYYKSMKH